MHTPDEMAAFAKRFTKEQWAILCNDQLFLDTVADDISKMRIHAEKLLAKHKKESGHQ